MTADPDRTPPIALEAGAARLYAAALPADADGAWIRRALELELEAGPSSPAELADARAAVAAYERRRR